ncbi:hypothetical protein MKW92_036454 [Papaver armeniacum]|nr:hypothetical protein MKW92_036454 [Papaver armeniacum]
MILFDVVSFVLIDWLAMWQTLLCQQKYLPFQVPDIEIKHLVAASVDFKGIGGVLFIFGSSLGAYLLHLMQLLCLNLAAFASTCRFSCFACHLVTLGLAKIDFVELLLKYSRHCVFGALLFFLGMKNSSPKRQPAKKKGPKAKTTKKLCPCKYAVSTLG